MPIYTRRIGAVHLPTADTWTLVGTAPSSGTTVIRDVLLVNASATTIPLVALRIRPGGSGATLWIGYWTSLPIGVTHLELRQVLAPSELLEAFTQTTTLDVLVTGYHFET